MTRVDVSHQLRATALVSVLALAIACLAPSPATAEHINADLTPACLGAPSAAELFDEYDGLTLEQQTLLDCFGNDGYADAGGDAVFQGLDDGSAGLDESVTRAQWASILIRIAEANGVDTGTAGDNPFTDVPEDGTHRDNIVKASQLGLTAGKTADTYDPNGTLVDRQLATFTVRLLELINGADDLPAGDGADIPAHCGDAHGDNCDILADLGLIDATAFDGEAVSTRYGAFLLGGGQATVFAVEGAYTLNPYTGRTVNTIDSATNRITYNDGARIRAFVYDEAVDTFYLDGERATATVFESSATPGDSIDILAHSPDRRYARTAGQAYSLYLTTVTANELVEGTVGNVDTAADTFDLIDPLSGVTLRDGISYAGATYSLDGGAVSLGSFEDYLSEGDGMAIRDQGTAQVSFALAESPIFGTLTALTGVDSVDAAFAIDPVDDDEAASPLLGDEQGSAEDALFLASAAAGASVEVYFVDGVQVPYYSGDPDVVDFMGALSEGDQIRYSLAAGQERFELTNAPPPTVSGVVQHASVQVSGGAGADDADGGSFDAVVGASEVDVTYTSGAKFVVDGVVSSEGELEDDLDAGDVITYTPADAQSGTIEELRLDNASVEGLVRVAKNPDNDGSLADELIDVENEDGGVIWDNLIPSLGSTPRYFVNGTEYSAAVFEDVLDDIYANQNDSTPESPDDTLRIAETGSGRDYHLTTDNTAVLSASTS